jgi:hypothetical protein
MVSGIVLVACGCALALVSALVFASASSAHAPLGAGNNESLASATQIPDPTKSWAIYADLHAGGEAQYYRLRATRGDSITVMLFTSPAKAEDGFVPSLVIMGPGIPDRGTAPGFVEKPPGAGVTVVPGSPAGHGSYEPFSPSAIRQVAAQTLVAPQDGTYYLAVYGNDRGGRYSLAIGSRESFTPAEWATLPFVFPTIYQWEGEPLWFVFAPAAVVLVLGLGLLLRRGRRGSRLDLVGWTASLAGLLFVATGVTVVVQLVFAQLQAQFDGAAIVTLVLAALPIGVGWLTLRTAERNSGSWTAGSRAVLALLGLAAVVVWAGWLAGPALAIVAALLPPWRRSAAAVSSGRAPAPR